MRLLLEKRGPPLSRRATYRKRAATYTNLCALTRPLLRNTTHPRERVSRERESLGAPSFRSSSFGSDLQRASRIQSASAGAARRCKTGLCRAAPSGICGETTSRPATHLRRARKGQVTGPKRRFVSVDSFFSRTQAHGLCGVFVLTKEIRSLKPPPPSHSIALFYIFLK